MKNTLEILEVRRETITVFERDKENGGMQYLSSMPCVWMLANLAANVIGFITGRGGGGGSGGGVMSGNSCVSCAVWAEDPNICMIAEIDVC